MCVYTYVRAPLSMFPIFLGIIHPGVNMYLQGNAPLAGVVQKIMNYSSVYTAEGWHRGGCFWRDLLLSAPFLCKQLSSTFLISPFNNFFHRLPLSQLDKVAHDSKLLSCLNSHLLILPGPASPWASAVPGGKRPNPGPGLEYLSHSV